MKYIGMDEAGRGALAGPLVAASVELFEPFTTFKKRVHVPIRDSKTLSEHQRQIIFSEFCRSNNRYSTCTISVKLINKYGISWANMIAFRKLFARYPNKHIIVDGILPFNNCGALIRSIPHADAVIPEVILAGIIAKVTRDRIMLKLSYDSPGYFWHNNKGYGTEKHINAIKQCGTTSHHRIVFVQSALAHSSIE